MASKVHTTDPKHHAYVCVNKRERKKVKRLGVKRPLLTLLARETLYLIEHIPYGWRHHYGTETYIPRGTQIIWDDCNHKTYRKLVKRANGTWRMVTEGRWSGRPKHFKKPYSCEY